MGACGLAGPRPSVGYAHQAGSSVARPAHSRLPATIYFRRLRPPRFEEEEEEEEACAATADSDLFFLTVVQAPFSSTVQKYLGASRR